MGTGSGVELRQSEPTKGAAEDRGPMWCLRGVKVLPGRGRRALAFGGGGEPLSAVRVLRRGNLLRSKFDNSRSEKWPCPIAMS
jgi:hypothetical protein